LREPVDHDRLKAVKVGVWKPVDASNERSRAAGSITRSAADATALGMAFQLCISPDGARRFTFVGQRCLAVNGVPAELVMADPDLFYDLVLPEHREAFAAAEAHALAHRTPFDMEVALLRPDGEVRWHRIASTPREQPDGSLLWDGLQIDVTDRRRMAAELEEQRRKVEVAVEATDMGLWEFDLRSDTLTWSERNRRLFGLSPSAPVTPQIYMDMVHPDDRPQLCELYLAARDRMEAGDFSTEYRIVTPAGQSRWMLTHGRTLADDQGPRLMVGTSLDVTERRAGEERRSLLMGELAHRAKNGLAVMMAIISQTARGAKSVQEYEAVLMARMQAMASSQDLVTATGGRPVEVSQVMAKALAPFDLERFKIDDALEGVAIGGELAAAMGLLLHEMATNAVKYGALSSARGHVHLTRAEAPEGRLGFAWSEQDGPPVTPSNRRGFGTRLLQQALRTQDGAVTDDFEPGGFHARVECPAAP
jgi:PAS domain S-box-containing protein